MLMDQNSKYKNAVGKRNIASRVSSDQIRNPVNMRSGRRTIGSADAGLVTRKSINQSSAKTRGAIVAEESIRSKGPRSMGSSAGFRGEKSAYLQMNNGGYMGASKRAYSKANIGSVKSAVFQAKEYKTAFANKLSGRFAKNSMSKMSTIKSLSRLV